jgi:hypothetical protein
MTTAVRDEKRAYLFQPTKVDGAELKYVAHYLDRIDNSLERIANALEKGGVNENLRLQLMNIESAIRLTAGRQ